MTHSSQLVLSLARRLTHCRRWLTKAAVVLAVAGAGVSMTGCSYEDPDKRSPLVELPAPGFYKAWNVNLKLHSDDEAAGIYIRGDWLFVTTKAGRIYALKRNTGEVVFEALVDGAREMMYPPVLLNDYVAVPTTHTVELFRLSDGDHHRSLDIRAAIRAECIGSGTAIFVPVDSPNGGARIKRYDVLKEATHIPDWELMTIKGGTAGAPALFNDGLYMAASNGDVYALAGQTREPLWPLSENIFKAQADIVTPLFADEGGVYVGTTAGKFYCLGLTSGQVRWQYFGLSPVEVPPVVAKDTVYLYDPKVGWLAINKIESPDIKKPQFNREPRWASKDISKIISQDDKHTFVLNNAGKLVALDKKTGKPVFEALRKEFQMLATNTVDGTIYHVTTRGKILAVKSNAARGQFGEVVRLDDDQQPSDAVAAR